MTKTKMRYALCAAATVFLAAGSISSAAEPAEDRDLANGKKFYAQTCVACHGVQGKGTIPGVPNLANGREPLSKDDETLLRSMHDGLHSDGSPLAMPPMGANYDMSMDDLADVLAYMRATFGKK